MTSRKRYATTLCTLLIAVAAWACADRPTEVPRVPAAQLSAVKFWEVNASTRWNERATVLLTQRPPANAQAAASRILTYLSIAQYRAALAAEAGKVKSMHPSVSAAVGGASAAVLNAFFPLDVGTIEAYLDNDLAAPGWPGEKHDNAGAGESIGRAVGAAVLAEAATDNYLVVSPGVPPVGPGYWVSAPAAIVRSLHGVRPFFMTRSDQLRPGPPPAFGSPAFLTALAEIRGISDTRTAEQLAIAQGFSWATGPFTTGNLNLIADQLIVAHRRSEREAARILAYANAAAFDAQIACFDAKFTLLVHPTAAGRSGDHAGGCVAESSVLPVGSLVHHQRGHECADRCVSERAAAVGGDHDERGPLTHVRWHPLPLRHRSWAGNRSERGFARTCRLTGIGRALSFRAKRGILALSIGRPRIPRFARNDK